MKLSETPVNPGELARIDQLMGGHKGVLFCFTNTAEEKLVFKFQDESPVEALAGTRVVRAAGADTPGVRRATDTDYESLKVATQKLKSSQVTALFCKPTKKWKHMLLMEYASGTTLMAMRQNSLDEFLAALTNVEFQASLGKVLAADMFAGNPDRMFAGYIGTPEDGEKLQKKGWYHEQNLFMKKDGDDYKAVAIDNAYSPKVSEMMVKRFGVWGRYIGGIGIQNAGLAAALPNQAVEQAFLLFDTLLGTALEDHPDGKGRIEEATQHRRTFAANVAKAATEATKQLLKPGQHWKQQFKEDGADDTMTKDFRHRKRLMRQLIGGERTVYALTLANSDYGYRKWLLQHRYNQTGEEADELLRKGVEAYKQFRREHDNAV